MLEYTKGRDLRAGVSIVWLRIMKREGVPNSSTSYYKSKRCKLGSTAVDMSPDDDTTLHTDDSSTCDMMSPAATVAELHHVSVEAAQSSTTDKTDDTIDGRYFTYKKIHISISNLPYLLKKYFEIIPYVSIGMLCVIQGFITPSTCY